MFEEFPRVAQLAGARVLPVEAERHAARRRNESAEHARPERGNEVAVVGELEQHGIAGQEALFSQPGEQFSRLREQLGIALEALTAFCGEQDRAPVRREFGGQPQRLRQRLGRGWISR